ncbi:MAG: class I SAM-dependent methyltransferase [candidate division KSB1 bacterium]|nr:class I SAM-dependent methyltransferase [candidate division KSB1 bacterium]MDZ7301852.1 class I SAM-dependent methyltransferase [candidate division KSB1 bacterium]MDZ7310235.1 class I SAM-dependent methyltransferase [candidate division KSB1 bacterium]
MPDAYRILAAFYDTIYASRTQDIEFYVAMAREGNGPILEVGCGTGRITLSLAETGSEIHGIDASAMMLEILRNKLTARPELSLHIHEGDMRAFDLGRKFAQIFVPFRAFLHLDTIDDQLAALRCFHHHLLPDGRLIVDIFAPSYRMMSNTQAQNSLPAHYHADGRIITVMDHVTYVHCDQRIEVERHIDTVSPDGTLKRNVEHFHLRYIFRYEMELLLRQAGFRLDTVYGSFDRRPYDYHSGEMIFIARPT